MIFAISTAASTGSPASRARSSVTLVVFSVSLVRTVCVSPIKTRHSRLHRNVLKGQTAMGILPRAISTPQQSVRGGVRPTAQAASAIASGPEEDEHSRALHLGRADSAGGSAVAWHGGRTSSRPAPRPAALPSAHASHASCKAVQETVNARSAST